MYKLKNKFYRYCRDHKKFRHFMEKLDWIIRIIFFGAIGIAGVLLIYAFHLLILVGIGVFAGFAFAFSGD